MRNEESIKSPLNDEGYTQKELISDNIKERHYSEDSVDSVTQNRIPTKLKKTFYCSLLLFIFGVFLFIFGTVEWNRIGINNSYYFFILGLILLIPGVYYSFLFCKAKQVKSLDMRRTVYQHIPEL